MRSSRWAAGLVLGSLLAFGTAAAASAAAPAAPAALDVNDCVRIALGGNAQIEQAEAVVQQWQARLAEVESIYWPKLAATGYVAPMYTVRGGLAGAETHWQHLSDWGPYTHLQAVLALPLYSFGRVEAGERAAAGRTAVERARANEVRATVALSVKRLYYMRLFGLSIIPALHTASSTVKDAIAYAQEAFAAGTGEATQADIGKLLYAQSEVEKFLLLADNGARLAAAALKHTMGMPDDAEVRFAADLLPDLPNQPEVDLATAILAASKQRPEWTEIEQGTSAALALEQAEKLAAAPALFLAGMISYDWTPMRDKASNPYAYDPYNGVNGGVALGLQFDIDPALSKAKAAGAHALGDEVKALARFAQTGIPLQVKKAHEDVMQYRALVGIADRGVAATKRWLTFAAVAYTTGTGEARDVLEGLASYLQARRGYLESTQNYYIAQAELDYAMGATP